MTYISVKACQCDECGHQWLPSVENPKQCAKCKSYRWNDLGKQDQPQKTTREILDELAKNEIEDGTYDLVPVDLQKDWPLCSICRRPIIDGKWHDHPCE